jgi:hypothetical protein
MGGDQRLKLADQLGVPAEGEVGVQALLEGDQAGFVHACSGGSAQPLRCIGQRWTAPQGQGGPQALGRPRVVAFGGGLPRLAEQLLEAVQVELADLDPQQISGRPRDEHRIGARTTGTTLERPAETRYMALEDVPGGRRCRLAPQLVDKPIGGI